MRLSWVANELSRAEHEREPAALSGAVRIAERVHSAGGRCFLVGGIVRDALFLERSRSIGRRLGASTRGGSLAATDIDLEVHGLDSSALESLLRPLGPLCLVGQAFSVYKLRHEGFMLDVSLPRKDNRSGKGHKGFLVENDPAMGLREAARRRDLTLNAMALDLLDGELHDPWGGEQDIDRALLRAVDSSRFVEDPLRALRVLRFAARFLFDLDSELKCLCRDMPLDDLPAERIREELRRMLLHGQKPSVALQLGVNLCVWEKVLPHILSGDLPAALPALDRAAILVDRTFPADDTRAEAALLIALMAALPARQAERALDALGIWSQGGCPLRTLVLSGIKVQCLLADDLGDGTLRRCARDLPSPGGLLVALVAAQALNPEGQYPQALERALALGLERGAPAPLVRGGDLRAMGIEAGPRMGRILARLYDHQLSAGIDDRELLLRWLARDQASGPE